MNNSHLHNQLRPHDTNSETSPSSGSFSLSVMDLSWKLAGLYWAYRRYTPNKNARFGATVRTDAGVHFKSQNKGSESRPKPSLKLLISAQWGSVTHSLLTHFTTQSHTMTLFVFTTFSHKNFAVGLKPKETFSSYSTVDVEVLYEVHLLYCSFLHHHQESSDRSRSIQSKQSRSWVFSWFKRKHCSEHAQKSDS